MENAKPAILEKATKQNSKTIVQYQYNLAMQNKGKGLNTEEVLKAVDYLNDNPDLGFFMMAYDKESENKKEIGTLLITYSHEVFLNKSVYWFESVYVDSEYRGRGIFKQMFREIEEQVKSHNYPMKLYVETKNIRAQQVYQRMGMKDSGDIYLEDDFYFEDKTNFKSSNTFTYSLLNLQNTQDIQQVINEVPSFESIHGYDSANSDKIKSGIAHITNYRAQGEVVLIKDQENKNLIGSVAVYYEFSDWRNGLIVYLSDIRLQSEIIKNKAKLNEILEGLFSYCKLNMPTTIPKTCLRVVIKEHLPIVNDIKDIGLQQATYRVYIKE